jgi:4-hydroxy-tetrahydrodipicolinate synthase
LKPGSTVALITPFTDTGAIDYSGLKRLLEYHVESGTDNLCILGTTGESATMTKEERTKVLKLAVDTVKGKMPIMAGTGTINPSSVKEMTQQALDLGCDAGLIVTPYYVKPPQRGLVKHYLSMAEIGLPVVIYNVPGRTGVNILDESVLLAAEHPNIVGLKDATGDLARIENMVKLLGDKKKDFIIYSGDDATTTEFVLKGGDGCISVTANLAARQMHEMVAAALAGDAAKAKTLNAPLDLLHNNLFCESNPMPTKWAAQQIGLIDNAYCRPPLDIFDEANLGSTVTDALKQAGLM